MPTFGSVATSQANTGSSLTFGTLASESANKPLFGGAATSQTTGFGSLAAQAQQQPTFGGFGQQQQGGSLFSSFSNSILNIFSFNIKIFVQLFNL